MIGIMHLHARRAISARLGLTTKDEKGEDNTGDLTTHYTDGHGWNN
jgi:hypothetical protein